MNPTKTPPGVEQDDYAKDLQEAALVNPTKTPPGVEQGVGGTSTYAHRW